MNAPARVLMLGDLIAAARRRAGDFTRWLADADPALAASLSAQLGNDEHPATRLRAAVADFVADASDEDWVTLVSVARDAPDPGNAALGVMLNRQLPKIAGR